MKAFVRNPLYSALFLSLGTAPVFAEEESRKLDEVTVWGTKVWASSVALDEDAVAIKQVDHISDLLRTLPGGPAWMWVAPTRSTSASPSAAWTTRTCASP